jgi:hypothetical protein
VFDEAHLRRVLKNYASYYNEVRTHLSLDKNAPDFRRPQKLGSIASISILGGLHHQYVRVQVLTKHTALVHLDTEAYIVSREAEGNRR